MTAIKTRCQTIMSATTTLECATCGQPFPSRNKLFKHLNDSGHGVETQSSFANSSAVATPKVEEKSRRGNQAYFEYYLRQKIINIEENDAKNEELWKQVYDNLRTPLPISYRIQESSWLGSDFARHLLALVVKDELSDWTIDEKDGESPLLRMIITKDCHQFNKSRNKDNNNRDKKLSSLTHALQELGAAHRQELVSAIPPLLLWSCVPNEGKKKDPVILADMCAAPGSKSLQLLDLLHRSTETNKSIPNNGLLVVNDSDRSRIVTLCQRSRRVPRSPMLAINMDARYFPGIRRRSGYKQKYDKVLVDTPCSGDGTARKNKQIWSEWSIAQAMSLHKLQRKILHRGLELLRPGATLVYSTCSLNPLENEAVISSVIEEIGGVEKVEIVPLPSWLTNKCTIMKGLSTWLVPTSKYGKSKQGEDDDESFDMYQSFVDVPPKLQNGKITTSMFPGSDQELKNQLVHCARFVPIKGNLDSGGFFVACLRRLHVGELSKKTKTEKQKSNNRTNSDTNNDAKRAKLSNDLTRVQSNSEADNAAASMTKEEVREGDWICVKCNVLNFGRRDSKCCIGCKARKPNMDASKSKKVDTLPPLLRSPCSETELKPFLDFFGISSSNKVFQNVRVIHRKNERTVVLTSEAVTALSISEQWGAFREAGISLLTMRKIPTEEGKEQRNGKDSDVVSLFDEAVPILILHAQRRHIKLEPLLFQKALSQALRDELKKEIAETERIKSTLDLNIPLGDLCGSTSWYETQEEISREAGVFVASCTCLIKGKVGHLSFWGRVHADGSISIGTSSRVLAAMLVVLQTFLEVSP